jgi:hypothetical protein
VREFKTTGPPCEMIQTVLTDSAWLGRTGEEDLRALTPLIHADVNPCGRFELDSEARLPLDDPAGLMAWDFPEQGRFRESYPTSRAE